MSRNRRLMRAASRGGARSVPHNRAEPPQTNHWFLVFAILTPS